MTALTAHFSENLRGTITVPGDKSISHRALIFGAMASDETQITGLLEAGDVLATATACTALGAKVKRLKPGHWQVIGCGTGGFRLPQGPLDFGNSGTAARLMMGAVAGHQMSVQFIGDNSLSSRPMGRVLKPLAQMGLNWQETNDHLPLTLSGTENLIPICYRLPVPSAQVKSAILIAGLLTTGRTTVIEPTTCRDHTERMLGVFGANIEMESKKHETHIHIHGPCQLRGTEICVPGDPSSAAFLAASALICPGCDILIQSVLVNPTRIGFYQTLKEMGADLTFLNKRLENGEPIADIQVKSSRLQAIDVPPERAPSMIDEYPILAIIASFADGTTTLNGLQELRVKESDRLQVTYDGLCASGVRTQIKGDNLIIYGKGHHQGGKPQGGALIATHMDHRIAMSFLIMGLASKTPITVDDIAIIKTSFPEFIALMTQIGAKFSSQ